MTGPPGEAEESRCRKRFCDQADLDGLGSDETSGSGDVGSIFGA